MQYFEWIPLQRQANTQGLSLWNNHLRRLRSRQLALGSAALIAAPFDWLDPLNNRASRGSIPLTSPDHADRSPPPPDPTGPPTVPHPGFYGNWHAVGPGPRPPLRLIEFASTWRTAHQHTGSRGKCQFSFQSQVFGKQLSLRNFLWATPAPEPAQRAAAQHGTANIRDLSDCRPG